MNITDAAANQADFDAVMNGSASDDQCANVANVAEQLRAYLQEAALRAKALPERRDAYFALLSPATKADVIAALPDALAPAETVAAPAQLAVAAPLAK